jgi:transketolase
MALRMVHEARSAHVGGSFSMADLMAALYGGVLRVDPSRPEWPDRDRFILSKGHACAAFYAALASRGFFPEDWLDTFYRDGGRLAGHASHTGVPGVEFSTGSLGHGLSVATGMALAAKRDGAPWRTFALLSDGECDEGSTWEPILFAPQHRLDNLVAIVDYNKIQSLGRTKDVLDLDPFADKWKAFGWAVREIDGHDMDQVLDALTSVPFVAGKPSCVIAHTVKGKGVSFMEDKLLWHYRNPSAEEYAAAVAEIEGGA